MDRRSFLLSAMAITPMVKLLCATLSPSASAQIFEDVTTKSGIRFKQESSPTSQKYLPESMVGGVAMFDYDNDGWLDLFFVNGANFSTPCPTELRQINPTLAFGTAFTETTAIGPSPM